jgi:DNA-binding transcriptional LysR family regulator
VIPALPPFSRQRSGRGDIAPTSYGAQYSRFGRGRRRGVERLVAMSPRVDLLTLRLFVAVVEESSLTKAAERYNIANSAVSKRISFLEETFKIELLHRLHKGVEPTPEGLALLRHAREILRSVDDLEGELHEFAKGTRGSIRVVANESTIFGYLPEELSAFLDRFPLVQVSFQAQTSHAVVQSIIDNVADIGIFAGEFPTADLQVFKYKQDRIAVVVPKGHELARRKSVRFSDLLDFDLVDQEPNSSIDAVLSRAYVEAGRVLRTRIRVSSSEAACRMVEANLGIAFVNERIATCLSRVTGIVSLRLDEAWAVRQHRLCVRGFGQLPIAARLLVEHLIPGIAARAS